MTTAVTTLMNPRYFRSKNGGKLQLATLASLDHRTLAFRKAKQMIVDMEDEIGGDLSVSQRELVEHAAVLGVMIESMAAQWLHGETIDQSNYALLINAQRRILAAL